MRAVRGCVWIVAACAAGCSFNRNDAVSDAAPEPDPDAPDAPPDVAMLECEQWTPPPQHFMPCMIPMPMEPGLTIASNAALDTTAKVIRITGGGAIDIAPFSTEVTQPDGTVALVLSVRALTVEDAVLLRIVGDKPLIVASWSRMTIAGTVDVGSRLTVTDPGGQGELVSNFDPGAGSQPTSCTTAGDAESGGAGGGSGGGGGGAFQGAGGTGGRGDTGGPNDGGSGAMAVVMPATVRGGCAGGASGPAGTSGLVTAPSNSTTTSPAGRGGGAVQLTARMAIDVTGVIHAGGSGGGPAQKGSACGGGGAGSGGFIGLEAPTITLDTAILAANGGGGGASARFADRGNPGQDGLPGMAPAQGAAPVVPSASCAAKAPNGSAAATLDGGSVPNNQLVDCGGGGGGGGAGWILMRGTPTITSTIISPPHTMQ